MFHIANSTFIILFVLACVVAFIVRRRVVHFRAGCFIIELEHDISPRLGPNKRIHNSMGNTFTFSKALCQQKIFQIECTASLFSPCFVCNLWIQWEYFHFLNSIKKLSVSKKKFLNAQRILFHHIWYVHVVLQNGPHFEI